MPAHSFNLSPIRDYIDATHLPSVIEKYLDDARTLRRLKSDTIASYEYLFSLLLEWWAEVGPALKYELDTNAWSGYTAWLEKRSSRQSGQPLAASVRSKAISLCRQLLVWCYRQRILSRDFSADLPHIPRSRTIRTLPDIDDLRRLLHAAGEGSRPIRDQAILAVFIGTGMRRGEATGLDIEDIQFHANGGGTIHIRHAKNGKQRKVAFDHLCGKFLLALIEELGREEGPLFTGWKDRRLSAERVAEAVKRALRAAGIDQRGRAPHELRRVFVTEWNRRRRSMGDGQLLSMQVGHENGSMTLHYSHQTLDDQIDGFVSPLSAVLTEE